MFNQLYTFSKGNWLSYDITKKIQSMYVIKLLVILNDQQPPNLRDKE
jgi:hypothetical protein